MSPSQRALAPAGRPLDGLRILLVEDHDDTRELLALVLRDAGATITEANGVAAAIDALTRDPFSVLVSDIAMPDQDGYDLIRWLRSSALPDSRRNMPAVAVTAFGATEDRANALREGFVEHLTKPVDAAKLIAAVARVAAHP